jgi:hypothetical protein
MSSRGRTKSGERGIISQLLNTSPCRIGTYRAHSGYINLMAEANSRRGRVECLTRLQLPARRLPRARDRYDLPDPCDSSMRPFPSTLIGLITKFKWSANIRDSQHEP